MGFGDIGDLDSRRFPNDLVAPKNCWYGSGMPLPYQQSILRLSEASPIAADVFYLCPIIGRA